jgi:hypothetical protein
MDLTINFILKFKHFHWITPNYLFFKLKNYYYNQALDLINYSIHLFVIKFNLFMFEFNPLLYYLFK